MKVRELIEELKKHDPKLEVVLFTEGKCYPILQTQTWEEDDGSKVIELGGGWLPLEYN